MQILRDISCRDQNLVCGLDSFSSLLRRLTLPSDSLLQDATNEPLLCSGALPALLLGLTWGEGSKNRCIHTRRNANVRL